ncbi:MAG: UDP-N-acetylmuramate-L-alanine ligase [Microgenomates group bacterium GW2011_GWC1_41_8]|uniref:UDP-N-acetylmuramate--L-alanine ligase n=1 Tax=Candidatus Roizmanbacteria bacterium GW2011_GWA1_41_13 TaxID=1618474 RepID=A0A0G0V5N7_9BACT|nr:MAG: UDP-N-acetylmuramate-L-alanine ligase [Candidatus Levybacteria bacterium GW2011_GWA2_40_16]KKR95031.1 MAG: UDP-N-acetylmuramate-L-alanine ligase [Candidatus Roizmanbacteria bacterium GW2011_GWA1_41_13]KKS24785.1 MAG: UDP-N-acetylmuramate-L-alanine ligase [Microgenomates group bacterium GW2011_GWC1_41_8]OGK49072.1 MAG: UDP-N-acetylmuramate--L-alanine ligase [Candidatus Roizmanbacteria bacterium RIFCSPLOWO2_01_FULL_40_14]
MNKQFPFKSVYFVGIKGVGMTPLALIAKERGCIVYGSDVQEKFVTDEQLIQHHITPLIGFKSSNIQKSLTAYKPQEVLVVVTGAHNGMKNPEAVHAKKLNYRVLTHGEALGLFMQDKKQISVAGSHGKTTTSAMIAHILVKSKKDPSYAVGAGSILSLKTSGQWGNGDYFVAEADEYVSDPVSNKTPRFLYQKPHIAVITNIDFDHPDVFKSIDDVRKVFISFANQTDHSGCVIVNGDDTQVVQAIPEITTKKITYGISEHVSIRIGSISISDQKSTFELRIKDKKLCTVLLTVPGFHNIQNATAAAIAAHEAGISWRQIAHTLSTFSGTKRRFEFIAEQKGIKLFDDYAHHPREIEATLSAAKTWYPQSRIVVLFQPHTYSRTKALFDDFVTCFSSASLVGICDIFASAREKADKKVSSKKLVDEIKKQSPHTYYVKDAKDFYEKIGRKLTQNDILFTMGAGDIYTWHGEIIKHLSLRRK